MKLTEYHDEIQQLLNRHDEILRSIEGAKRKITNDEQAKLDEIQDTVERLSQLAVQKRRQGELEASWAEEDERRRRESAVKVDPAIEREREAVVFDRWIRGGMNSLTGEERAVMARRQVAIPAEVRAQAVGTGGAGGYTVPEDFQREIEKAMLNFGGVREVARVIRTATGADLPYPTVDDTSNTGAILAENTQVSEQDVTFGQLTLNSYMYTSKLIRVSYQLLQDSAFDMGSFLRDALAERIGRILNQHFTTGTGSGQPNGIVTAATDSSVDFDISDIDTNKKYDALFENLTDLEFSVDASYRRGARWMLDDTFVKRIKKSQQILTAATPNTVSGLPIWQPSQAAGEPPTLLGYPYVVNSDMPAIGTNGNKTILFGNLSKYLIRDVIGFSLLRLEERYADYLQVGFLGFSRHDGDLLDAGTNPVKYANDVT